MKLDVTKGDEVAALRVGCALEIHDHTEAELAQAARFVADKYDPPMEKELGR